MGAFSGDPVPSVGDLSPILKRPVEWGRERGLLDTLTGGGLQWVVIFKLSSRNFEQETVLIWSNVGLSLSGHPHDP